MHDKCNSNPKPIEFRKRSIPHLTEIIPSQILLPKAIKKDLVIWVKERKIGIAPTRKV